MSQPQAPAETLAGGWKKTSAFDLMKEQRSHVLFVLSNAKADQEGTFVEWFQGRYLREISDVASVLNVQHYKQHEVDITQGRYGRAPLEYLGLYELALDGAREANALIELIATLHRNEAAAEDPATWLYYPISEKVGRAPRVFPSMLTLAFANGVAGREAEFREWYATRHIRHALNISALVSGQCFERTEFQRPGALEAIYSMIAVYEQEGTPEAIIESFATLPPGTFDFPAMDLKRFAECVYRPLP